jgi:hypothetical protein
MPHDETFPNLPVGTLPEDDSTARYCVEAAANYFEPKWAVTRYCHDKDDAKRAADQLHRHFRCVRLSEWADWSSPMSDRDMRGWVYFWWSDDGEFQARPEGSGVGIPEGRATMGSYRPVPRTES